MLYEYLPKKYDYRFKELLSSKTKVEPYLHVLITNDTNYGIAYCIYIWDTRLIVEAGEILIGSKNFDYLQHEIEWYLTNERKGSRNVIDNFESLIYENDSFKLKTLNIVNMNMRSLRKDAERKCNEFIESIKTFAADFALSKSSITRSINKKFSKSEQTILFKMFKMTYNEREVSKLSETILSNINK